MKNEVIMWIENNRSANGYSGNLMAEDLKRRKFDARIYPLMVPRARINIEKYAICAHRKYSKKSMKVVTSICAMLPGPVKDAIFLYFILENFVFDQHFSRER